jgi:uncharacterized protein (TIGR00297 family)
MVPLLQILFGITLAVLVAILAYQVNTLTRGGAIAAAIEGTIIFGLGGLDWAILLLAFFVSSSALSRAFSQQKASLAEKFSKTSRRDAGQVLANGGVASTFVLVQFVMKTVFLSRGVLASLDWSWVAFAASLAAVNADTWATELGVLSRSQPRLITSGAIVERGASGGVTLAGTAAALGGAAFIAVLAALLASLASVTPARVFLYVTFGGLVGALIDSALGASVQAIYYCPACQKETERHPLHSCGTPTSLRRGWKWLDNDWVNAACALSGALVGISLWLLLP